MLVLHGDFIPKNGNSLPEEICFGAVLRDMAEGGLIYI
jgi:hypothetical protein